MPKMVILAVVGLLLGLGGATSIVMVQTRAAAAAAADPAAADSPADEPEDEELEDEPEEHASEPVELADPTVTDPAVRDSIVVADLMRRVAADSAALASAAPQGARDGERTAAAAADPTVGPGVETVTVAAGTAADGEATGLPHRRIGKIFTAMQPKDAARVLEQMNDHDIGVILGMMGDRQAAAVLSSLSPTRAASISQQAIRAGGTRP